MKATCAKFAAFLLSFGAACADSLPETVCDDPGRQVRYRGIFINDEFLGLRPWAVRHFGREEQIGTNAYEEVFALMKRNGLNLLWPAMHPRGNPAAGNPTAYEYSERSENLAQAARHGIVIGTSHCEPMLRNNSLLSDAERKKWSWTKHRDWIEAYWREGVRRGMGNGEGGKGILWTIGMRGICDSGLGDGKTLRDKARIMEDVFATQCAMLPKDAPKLFVPYKEVMNIYNSGLKVPDDTIIMWANDNFGYVRRLGGPQAAGHGGGIYWHVSYFGHPHSYIHVCTTPPAFMWYELVAKCWNNGVQDAWMVNVGDVFQAELVLDAYGKFANAPDAWGADAQRVFLSGWAENLLSQSPGKAGAGCPGSDVLAKRISAHLAEYYNLGFIRKPELMCIQWATNIPASVKSSLHSRYHALLAEDAAIEEALPEAVRDKYFRIVGYQAKFLAYAGVIFLEGKGREYAHGVLDPLTERWNAMEGGKWAGLWYDTVDERGLTELSYRFRRPPVNNWTSPMQWPWNEPVDPQAVKRRKRYLATAYRADVPEPEWMEPVSRETGTENGEWVNVDGLGTSGNALALLPVKPGVGKGAALEYELGNGKTLVLQFLPDFALWPGLKLGVNVSFDVSPERSEVAEGELNAGCGAPQYVQVPKSDSNIGEFDPVRNRAVQDNFIRVEISVPQGARRVKIIATDPGVVIDRVGVR